MARPGQPPTQDEALYPAEPPIYGEIPAPPDKNFPQTSQADPNAPPPVTADPWATPPADGNWQAWFLKNVQGRPPTPAELIALEPILAKHGIKVLRNAEGVAGKITLPGGQIVDVIEAAGLGGKAWQWLTDDGGAGGNANAPDADWFAQNMPGPEPYSTLARPEHLRSPYEPGQFTAPGFDEVQADPGYQARLAAGVQGRERMASARGSILSGGHGKAMERYAQEFGANEYGNLYGRRFGEFQTAEGLKLGGRQLNENAYQTDVGNQFNQYGQRYRTWRDLIGDRFRLGEMGLSATTAGAPR